MAELVDACTTTVCNNAQLQIKRSVKTPPFKYRFESWPGYIAGTCKVMAIERELQGADTPERRGLFKFKTTTMQYNPRFNPGDQVYVMCENEIRKTTIREIRFYKDGTHHYCIDDPANEPNRAGLIVVGGDLAEHPMEIAKSLLNPYIFLGASISDLPSATVIFNGDPSVGIFPRYCNIELPFDLKDLSDEERKQAKEAIQKLYAELDNDERPASVYFSDETGE